MISMMFDIGGGGDARDGRDARDATLLLFADT